MGTIETFDHTADLGLRARADDLDDLFATMAGGLFDTIVANRDEVRAESTETIALSAESTADLLAAWLDELLFRSETGHRLFGRFAVRVSSDGLSLEGEASGEPIDRDRHVLDHEVKAITRHALRVEREGGGWIAEVIVNI